MKTLVTIFLFLYSSTLEAEAYKNVDEFYNQCKPIIDLISSDNLSQIENEDTQTNLMSGVCIGYFLGLVEGHQVGWISKGEGEEYCENPYNALNLIQIFEEDIRKFPDKKNENLSDYFYNLLLEKICN